MSELLVLEFSGVTADQYNAVNDILGVDSASGQGDWPPGLNTHVAGLDSGSLTVVETWDSRDAQAEFLHSRLGPALGQIGIGDPSRMAWYPVIGQKA